MMLQELAILKNKPINLPNFELSAQNNQPKQAKKYSDYSLKKPKLTTKSMGVQEAG
jgi:hypothetical protein